MFKYLSRLWVQMQIDAWSVKSFMKEMTWGLGEVYKEKMMH